MITDEEGFSSTSISVSLTHWRVLLFCPDREARPRLSYGASGSGCRVQRRKVGCRVHGLVEHRLALTVMYAPHFQGWGGGGWGLPGTLGDAPLNTKPHLIREVPLNPEP